MTSHLGKAFLLIGILLLGVMPIIHLVLANESLDTALIHQLSWHCDTFKLSWKTAQSSIITAILSSLIGWGICHTLRSSRSPQYWLALYTLCFAMSPYIAAQGWIQIFGIQGSFWKFFSITPQPQLLFSSLGMTFLMCLQFVPLSLIIFYTTLRLPDREMEELKRLTSPPLWQKLYLFHLRPGLAVLMFSTILIFWLAFWNYETPSILRQNTYALSVYAAFGSFYDYNQALGYLYHAIIYAIPTLILILWIAPELGSNVRSLACTSSISRGLSRNILSIAALLILPLCGLFIPLTGIIADVDSIHSLTTHAKDYATDIKNTLIVSSSASLSTVLLCLSLVYVGAKLNARPILGIAAMILLVIPALCSGIGAVHWFAENTDGEAGLERIILVNILILLPILLLPASLAFPRHASSQADMLSLNQLGPIKKLLLFGKPILLPKFLLLFGFGFLMSMREVPASLLNYPPDGSTLALTIETMLHFDQPHLISSLCLIQLLISVMVFSAIAILYRLCKQ